MAFCTACALQWNRQYDPEGCVGDWWLRGLKRIHFRRSLQVQLSIHKGNWQPNESMEHALKQTNRLTSTDSPWITGLASQPRRSLRRRKIERNNSCYNLHAAVGVHCNHTNLLTLGYPVTMTSPPDLHRPCAADHLPEAAFRGLEIVLVVVVVSDIECNVPVFCPGSPKRNWPRHLKTKQEILNMILCIIN